MHEQIGLSLILCLFFLMVESTVKCMHKLTSLRVMYLPWVRGHHKRAGDKVGTEEAIICLYSGTLKKLNYLTSLHGNEKVKLLYLLLMTNNIYDILRSTDIQWPQRFDTK